MPIFNEITYSLHARQRMRQRHITLEDVALVLQHGEAILDEDGTWMYELGTLRVIVDERDATAHVVTVIRLRRRT